MNPLGLSGFGLSTLRQAVEEVEASDRARGYALCGLCEQKIAPGRHVCEQCEAGLQREAVGSVRNGQTCRERRVLT